MLKSPYKIKHWSPVKKVLKSVDPYWNVTEWEEIDADEYPIYVGNGIWDQMKPIDCPPFTVETLYELISQDDWFILDYLLRDREDLQERIKKYKESRVA